MSFISYEKYASKNANIKCRPAQMVFYIESQDKIKMYTLGNWYKVEAFR